MNDLLCSINGEGWLEHAAKEFKPAPWENLKPKSIELRAEGRNGEGWLERVAKEFKPAPWENLII